MQHPYGKELVCATCCAGAARLLLSQPASVLPRGGPAAVQTSEAHNVDEMLAEVERVVIEG